MKTRFSSLVNLKKNNMQKSERVVQKANANLHSASTALQLSYTSLNELKLPTNGAISEFLASKSLFNSQRDIIKNNQEWVLFAKNQVSQAKEKLKLDMIEHEKFKYLELEEIKKIQKAKKLKEVKDLDEVAMMTYNRDTMTMDQ